MGAVSDECPLCGGVVREYQHIWAFWQTWGICCRLCGFGTRVRFFYHTAFKEWVWLRNMALVGIKWRNNNAKQNGA